MLMKDGAKIFQIKEAGRKLAGFYNKAFSDAVKFNMTRWLSFLLILAFPYFCTGQIGLNVKALFGQSGTLDAQNISQDGMQASIEYYFRLKQKRIEFHPGLGYRFTWNTSDTDGHFNSVDFDMNTAIYPFDYAGDCHCPTFSKGGDLFKKGFFLELDPGVGYQMFTRLRSDPDDPSRLPIHSDNVVGKIGGAAGLDIGLSDFITVTPLLSMTYLTSSKWEGLNKDGSAGQLKDYMYLGIGLRVVYRSDGKRRNRF